MRKKNNFLLKATLTTAAIGLGTFIYRKYNQRKQEQDGIVENEGVIEIEEFEDDFCCECDNDSFTKEDLDSTFEIKLENNSAEVEQEKTEDTEKEQ